MKKKIYFAALVLIVISPTLWFRDTLSQQPQVRVGTSTGVRARVAVADFQIRANDPQLTQYTRLFNEVLWSDLDMAGVFEVVPKSFYSLKLPSQPAEVIIVQWESNEVSAQDLAYGSSSIEKGQVVGGCRLPDVSAKEASMVFRFAVEL